MATLEKLAVEREKLCRMDLNDPGILAQSRIVDELSGGETMNKVIYLRQEDKPMRSVLLPKPKRRWRWNWRRAARNLVVTAGLIAVWLMALTVATGGH